MPTLGWPLNQKSAPAASLTPLTGLLEAHAIALVDGDALRIEGVVDGELRHALEQPLGWGAREHVLRRPLCSGGWDQQRADRECGYTTEILHAAQPLARGPRANQGFP
jgi:hypothetical protein